MMASFLALLTNSAQGGRLYRWQHLQNTEDKPLAKLREEHTEEVAELKEQHLVELIALKNELNCTSKELKLLQRKSSNGKLGDLGKVDSSCQTSEFWVKSSQELGGAVLKPGFPPDLPGQLHPSSLTVTAGRGKVMSQGANKLQRPFLANSIYSRNPISKMSINSCENQINSCRH